MIFKRKCKITFIRHGATINTEENRLFDDENYPALNAAGKYEMEKIANWVNNKGLKIDKIFASSALRSVQSAEILSKICRHDFEILPDLRSRKNGLWSGMSFTEIEKKYNNHKKAIPILENIIKTYKTLTNPEEKNKLLSSIIKEIIYTKDKGGLYLKDNFTLKIILHL